MNILTCISYYGTGSSAVTDFVSEFSNVKSMTNYEFRFAQDPDGLSELEYNLVENFNRHNSGHALKRYKKLVDYYGNHFLVKRYEPFFNNNWKKLSYEYIASLTDFSFPGCWQYDFYDRGPLYEFWHKLPDRILHKTIWKRKIDKHLLLTKENTYASHPTEDKFLSCTRKYTDSLLAEANKENKTFLMVDQILPSTNINRHIRYFNNIKAIIVDRDPRDLFLLAKYVWNDNIVPSDVETFCKWFKYIRSNKEKENCDKNIVKFIQFEDLIYKYNETTKAIMEWIGLKEEDHNLAKKVFNPNLSIKNTRLWESIGTSEEINYIKKNLENYLYCY